jgi:hypothetical protein
MQDRTDEAASRSRGGSIDPLYVGELFAKDRERLACIFTDCEFGR